MCAVGGGSKLVAQETEAYTSAHKWEKAWETRLSIKLKQRKSGRMVIGDKESRPGLQCQVKRETVQAGKPGTKI